MVEATQAGRPKAPTADKVEWSKPDQVIRWARLFGVCRNTMSRRLNKGQIRGQRFGKCWMIALDDIHAAIRKQCRGG
jgi:hypothetical protein